MCVCVCVCVRVCACVCVCGEFSQIGLTFELIHFIMSSIFSRRSVDLRIVPSRALCDYAGQSDHVITSPWKTHPIPKDITISNLLISRWSLATDKTALVCGCMNMFGLF